MDPKIRPLDRFSPAGEITPEVLEALRTGSHEAYRMVYLQFVNPLTDFIGRLTRSRSTAEDLTQEILASVWEKRAGINIHTSVKGYLFTVARHTVADYFRKRGIDLGEWNDNDQIAGQGAPDESLVARETEMIVRLTVGAMPRRRRTIFELSNDKGLSNEEIAKKLGISKTTVEKQISYARREIRQVLGLFALLFLNI